GEDEPAAKSGDESENEVESSHGGSDQVVMMVVFPGGIVTVVPPGPCAVMLPPPDGASLVIVAVAPDPFTFTVPPVPVIVTLALEEMFTVSLASRPVTVPCEPPLQATVVAEFSLPTRGLIVMLPPESASLTTLT